ncbi:kinase-like protein [Mollisia scopiformis]|uniref:non-specific serine/threonine protein kinase n=1 Tax=Mollisia scopiformis TaxID=149040 RepID=A0A194X709_MOLSC|nr:kinase-like protein [Mollisia scopiformis]KUJ15960.1 kinase-like protein [Mollisia scopiformis]
MSLSRAMTMSMSSSRPPAKIRKEPSPERERPTQELIQEILEELDSVMKMKRPDKPAKAYACHDDLKIIWKRKRIKALIGPSNPSDAQVDFIQKNMIIILSTLVWIGASKCLTQFRSRFFEPIASCEARFTDKQMPCFDKDKLYFLDSEPALKGRFHENHFHFCPVKINIENRQTTQEIDPNEKLPFERIEKGVGSGGFGKVDKVAISPKYYYHKKAGQDTIFVSEEVYVVACKKIKLKDDFDKEKDNLQILKESLTKHVRIMLHLTTIEHGLSRYILLPYAAYGDLEVFLHGGYAPGEKTPKYDFDNRFKRLNGRDMILPLFAECLVLADALKWLHNQIRIEKTSDTVFCAHMDLKPANILIQPDDKSVVGKWMISDFGISVFKEDTEQHDPDYGSIGDYISQVTMNTRPKRQEGTYQAPEVKLAEIGFNQSSHLTPDQRGIGRKSDVWSFGCILSEILAFSQGRAALVKEFSMARKKNSKDDYFYATATSESLGLTKSYEVRPTVISWLDDLSKKAASPQRWLDCYVGTIKKILIVDTTLRPSAEQLLMLMQHVKDHIKHSLEGGQVACRVLSLQEELKPKTIPRKPVRSSTQSPYSHQSPAPRRYSNPPVSKPRDSATNNLTPIMFRSTTFEQERIHPEGHEEDHGVELMETVAEMDSDTEIPSIDSTMPTAEAVISDPTSDLARIPGTLSTTESPRVPFPDQNQDHEPVRPEPHPIQQGSDQPEPNSGQRSSLFTSYARPAHAHGIKIDRNPPPMIQPFPYISLPPPAGSTFKITSMALTRSIYGARLACLSKSSIFIYTLMTKNLSGILDCKVDLPASNGWTGIAFAGNFLAAWGYDSGKLVYFCDLRLEDSRSLPTSETGMLEKVAVSEQGVAALVCRKKIVIVTMGSSKETISLYASGDQNFTHAAFNDTGDLLFAWAYGQTDKLYCWRCQDSVFQRATESESPYETVKIGKPDLTTVIPYNSYQGCIIEKPDKTLFPAQIRSTLRENKNPFPRNEVKLSNLQAACIFNDHSLITVEKGKMHRRLREYKISYSSTHVLETPGVEICGNLKSSTDSASRMLAVKDGENIVIIICNKNATVEFVKVVQPAARPIR